MRYFDGMTTPIGRLHIVVFRRAVVRIYLPKETWNGRYTRSPKHPPACAEAAAAGRLIRRAKKELKEYFSGRRKIFTVPVHPCGTVFQQKAWRVLQKIPYGATISYAEEARRMGRPKAVRAVGSANGRNPLPIIVPCHRVIAKSGGFGGYAGGLSVKKKLLALEQKFVLA